MEIKNEEYANYLLHKEADFLDRSARDKKLKAAELTEEVARTLAAAEENLARSTACREAAGPRIFRALHEYDGMGPRVADLNPADLSPLTA